MVGKEVGMYCARCRVPFMEQLHHSSKSLLPFLPHLQEVYASSYRTKQTRELMHFRVNCIPKKDRDTKTQVGKLILGDMMGVIWVCKYAAEGVMN